MARAGGNGNAKKTAPKLDGYFDWLVREGHFKNYGEIAKVCDMEASGLSNILKDPSRRLSIGQCLRLARKTGEDASTVLRVARRGEDADVLDDLRPTKQDLVHLTRNEREMVKQWRQLTRPVQHHLRALIEHYAEQARAAMDGHPLPARNGRRGSTPRLTPGRSR